MDSTNSQNSFLNESDVIYSLKNSQVDSLTIINIQRLYSDQDELVRFISTLKDEASIREDKLKQVISKLSNEIRKFKQQNIDQHDREQKLRSLCETMLSRDSDVESEKRESEDVTKVLQVLLNSSDKSNLLSPRSNHTTQDKLYQH